MTETKLNSLSLGYAGAIVSAVMMLLLGILGNLGIYSGAVQMMSQWHMFFSLTSLGTVAGIVEEAVVTFVLIYAFGWLYNKLV